jgi:cytosine/adenosine deaminase-related metal-dependent hydrolase
MKRLSATMTSYIEQSSVLTVQVTLGPDGTLSTISIDTLRRDGDARLMRVAPSSRYNSIDLFEMGMEALAIALRREIEGPQPPRP